MNMSKAKASITDQRGCTEEAVEKEKTSRSQLSFSKRFPSSRNRSSESENPTTGPLPATSRIQHTLSKEGWRRTQELRAQARSQAAGLAS